ncbi:MAG TPA: NAD(P)/FAD-dependent oxidoreductase [Candidatus Hydrogenedens sp.]|nr:NAD(P)/FAD-dependent oxidoreductase [Candidatus Hydrogenedens sp.]HOK08751.1 NAD(P)/FAD-dependent oxidoreductase [Candidatus Hydrogenedens sp.]HOL20989.1 NAD(P)/FAD-dependent oxidoreductase [Candidatus Hydrogenedens sp.]HPP57559.1 NAD(P)/FAD-dependent oxidoreductase [Candidatus Hydrogenedens sp.]
MNSKIYDVAIIGAGCCGASIARRLSAYEVSVALLEKCIDVGFGVTKANSGIIHAGFHHPITSLKARLEIRGNLMFDQLHYELGFPFKRVGVLVVAFSVEEMKTIEHLYAQGVANGVPRMEICGRERILNLEPQLNPDVVGGLYAPTGGIIEPYRYVFSLVESAQKNGVDVLTQFTVNRGVREHDYWVIESKEGKTVKAKYVVNSAGLFADEVSKVFNAEEYKIIPRKGEEFLLQRNAKGLPNHVIFPVPGAHTKGILVIPTVEGTLMVGPTAIETDDKEDVETSSQNLETIFMQATYMVPAISRREIITSFAGLRPTLKGNDFYIEPSKLQPNFIHVSGIQSPGLTASPAIGEYVKDLLKQEGLTLIEKKEYDPFLPHPIKVRDLTFEQLAQLVEKDSKYGHIVCRCENVSEAEVIEAISKGHITLDGIKFYTRAGMGRCQGAFCTYKILKIISKETGIPIEKITKRGDNSWIVYQRLQDFAMKQIQE